MIYMAQFNWFHMFDNVSQKHHYINFSPSFLFYSVSKASAGAIKIKTIYSSKNNGENLIQLNWNHGELQVTSGEKLVTMARESKTLNSLGYQLPKNVVESLKQSQKFQKYAVILKEVYEGWESEWMVWLIMLIMLNKSVIN